MALQWPLQVRRSCLDLRPVHANREDNLQGSARRIPHNIHNCSHDVSGRLNNPGNIGRTNVHHKIHPGIYIACERRSRPRHNNPVRYNHTLEDNPGSTGHRILRSNQDSSLDSIDHIRRIHLVVRRNPLVFCEAWRSINDQV